MVSNFSFQPKKIYWGKFEPKIIMEIFPLGVGHLRWPGEPKTNKKLKKSLEDIFLFAVLYPDLKSMKLKKGPKNRR